MNDDQRYIEGEFAKLVESEYSPKIKIISGLSETKWLNVSPTAVAKIKQILIEDRQRS